MTILLIVLILLFALIAAGTPVYIALGLSSLVYFFSEGLAGVAAVHTMINGVNSFTLIAVPFLSNRRPYTPQPLPSCAESDQTTT